MRSRPRPEAGPYERTIKTPSLALGRPPWLASKRPRLALAWVLAQGPDVVPIPGTKRRSYLAANIAALEVVLDADDLRSIDEAAPKRHDRW
jgi:aryl-alcohol dehydrogenase-like predicted oxidoreductase